MVSKAAFIYVTFQQAGNEGMRVFGHSWLGNFYGLLFFFFTFDITFL